MSVSRSLKVFEIWFQPRSVGMNLYPSLNIPQINLNLIFRGASLCSLRQIDQEVEGNFFFPEDEFFLKVWGFLYLPLPSKAGVIHQSDLSFNSSVIRQEAASFVIIWLSYFASPFSPNNARVHCVWGCITNCNVKFEKRNTKPIMSVTL